MSDLRRCANRDGKAEFPKTLPYIKTVIGRRWIARGFSMTEILPLRDDGTVTVQDDPTALLGLYFWNGKQFELEARYNTQREARSAQARLRRKLPKD
jgi:hypothetical protein